MNGNRFFAVAALIAGVAFASTAAAQQSMYRCGNKYQDKPCDDGQKGRVVGTTGAPPAVSAKGGSERPAMIPEQEQAMVEVMNAQRKAEDCVKLRQLLRETKNYRAKEMREAEMEHLRCARVGDGGWGKEERCAKAARQEAAEACKEYMSKER